MPDGDFDDERTVEEWLSSQRDVVEAHLARAGFPHGASSARPAWHLAPYLAIWAVESRARPGTTGWWAVSGDVPTDYLSAMDASDPRTAMLAFSRQWSDLATKMSRGEADPDTQVGSPEDWPRLAPLLAARAQLLKQFAENDEAWA